MGDDGLDSSCSGWDQVAGSCEHIKVFQDQPKAYRRSRWAKNLTPLETRLLNIFGLEQSWRKFLRALAEILNNTRRNSFAC
jgi:hypothetical protein